ILNDRNPKENRQMKKLMTLMAAVALTFGAATMYANGNADKSTTVKKTTKIVKKTTTTKK
ncbi:MAG: hypothetical protein ABSH40_22380, partial [Bryobacteraceae bacterium]